MPGPTVVTIGNFDGVHVGHAALIAHARALAGERGRVIAMAFDPHPLARLRPHAAPARLSTFAQRREWLRAAGADDVALLAPTDDLLALAPEAFVERVVRDWAPVAIVEGPDFRFGKGRAGDVGTLARLGAQRGFACEVVQPVEATLSDQTVAPASSTLARWLVARGRMRDASAVLGRPYEMVGAVVRGDRRGRTIGCPTANLESELLAPADGVYAGSGRLADGRIFPAAVSVGTKPTFGASACAVEAHLIGWAGPLDEGTPEYGWELRLSIGHWLRDQARYDSVDALVEQIARDVSRAAERFDDDSAAPHGAGSRTEASV